MRQVSLDELRQMVDEAREAIWQDARSVGREPKIYLHWTAGRYDTCFPDYHINITGDGDVYVSTEDLSETLSHTWKRNTGSIGITLCCAYGADTNSLGDYPPTDIQIEMMAQVIAVVASGLWLTIDKAHVLTHSEAADNADGEYCHEPYGCQSTVERWDLQYLGTAESPYYTSDYDNPITGGNVLRGKANFYRSTWANEGK